MPPDRPFTIRLDGVLVVPRNAVTSAEAVAGTRSATANGSATMRAKIRRIA